MPVARPLVSEIRRAMQQPRARRGWAQWLPGHQGVSTFLQGKVIPTLLLLPNSLLSATGRPIYTATQDPRRSWVLPDDAMQIMRLVKERRK